MGNAEISHNQTTVKTMLALTIVSMDAPKIADTSECKTTEPNVKRLA